MADRLFHTHETVWVIRPYLNKIFILQCKVVATINTVYSTFYHVRDFRGSEYRLDGCDMYKNLDEAKRMLDDYIEILDYEGKGTDQ